jgi:hypothetical protein
MQGKESKVEISFNQEKHSASVVEKGNAPRMQVSQSRGRLQKHNKPSVQTSKCSQDLFSTIYYLRLMDLNENASYSIPVYYDKRNWVTKIKISTPWNQDFTKIGNFSVFKANIDSDLNEMILGMREITGTLTTDSRRIPLEFRFGSGIGSFYGKIREIRSSDG